MAVVTALGASGISAWLFGGRGLDARTGRITRDHGDVDDLVTTSSGPWGTGNAEMPAYTGLMNRVRQDARDRLEQSVRELGADGVIVSAMTLRVRSDPCHAHAAATDHFAEAITTGSAVTRFAGRTEAAPPPSLAVLHLDADAGQRRPGGASRLPRCDQH